MGLAPCARLGKCGGWGIPSEKHDGLHGVGLDECESSLVQMDSVFIVYRTCLRGTPSQTCTLLCMCTPRICLPRRRALLGACSLMSVPRQALGMLSRVRASGALIQLIVPFFFIAYTI